MSMGLDTFAVKPEQDEAGLWLNADPEDFAEVGPLTGGLFSGNGNDGSFRGKVYSDLIEEATGESLYQAYIAPETVAKMSAALDDYAPLGFLEDYEAESLPALRQFFAVCKARGYGLVGWW